MHAAVMYQRITFHAMGDFDPSLDACEDYDLSLRVARRLPIATHAGLVAEYRRHGTAITRDADRMRRAALRVLGRQRAHIEGRDDLTAASDEGRAFWLGHYPPTSIASAVIPLSAQAGPVPATRRSGRNRGSAGRVLMYHRIGEPARDPWGLAVSPVHFAEHLEVLRRERNVMSLSDATRVLEAGPLPADAVLVTFDDGYADNLHAGLPALERHEVPAAVFVSTGYFGRPHGFWWDELERILFEAPSLPGSLELDVRASSLHVDLAGLPERQAGDAADWRALTGGPSTARQVLYERLWTWMWLVLDAEREEALDKVATWAGAQRTPAGADRPLSTSEVAEMAQHPLLGLGAHTVTHPRLSGLTASMQRLEIRESARTLEAISGRPTFAMAYPFGGPGDVDPDSVRAASEVGYRVAFMAVPEGSGGGHDRLGVPRHYVPDLDGDEFVRWLHADEDAGSAVPREEPAPVLTGSAR